MAESPAEPSADAQTTENSTLIEMLAIKADDPKLLSTPEASSYLSYLTSLPLPSLLAEPQGLSEETKTLTSQLTALCTSEYPTFISLHTTTSALPSALDSLSSSLDSLLSSIPLLEAETQRFAASTKLIQSERRKAALILEHHDKLLDILQIPQLIDTCVRNGYYAEAMDLSAHTVTLLARFPDVPVIVDIAAEAEQAIRLMSTQLLVLLREPGKKLPALFKAVNFLRRVGLIEEDELALAFLTSREVHLQGAFGGIRQQKDDHARYVRRYVDIFREGVYDVITQYTAIFLDRASAGDGKDDQKKVGLGGLHGTLRHLLQSYVHSQIMQLSRVLDTAIPQIDDPTVLTSLLTQLTYCATSFAKVGLDFGSILERPFVESVLLNATRWFEDAAREFKKSMHKHTHTTVESAARWFITPTLLASLSQTSIQDLEPSSPVHIVPSIISSFPLLAVYTNSILTALNSLRLLAPISLYLQLSRILEMSLVEVGRGLHQGIKASRGSGKKGMADVQAFETAGLVYLKCLVPFTTRALREGVFGVKGIREYGPELQDVVSELRSFLDVQDQVSNKTE